MTYAEHYARWQGCLKCNLCRTRKTVVLGRFVNPLHPQRRGKVPCDVVFIGEGPGESEDCEGEPFVGPAGHLQDDIIASAWAMANLTLCYALTNIVACIPRDEEGGKAQEPDIVSIKACRPRLEQFLKVCSPKAIVLVGSLAERHVSKEVLDVKYVRQIHPAAILKASPVHQGLMRQKAIVSLASGLEDFTRR